MKLLNIAIILCMTVFTSCGKAGNNKELRMKFEQQTHRVEIANNRLMYNDAPITLGNRADTSIDSILNYNGLSVIPIVENEVLCGVEIIFANPTKEWEALRFVINDDPEKEMLLKGNGQLKGMLQGFGDAEAVQKRIFEEIRQYGYSKLPITGYEEIQSMLFIPVYNKSLPDWHEEPDAAFVKFNNIYLNQNIVIDVRSEQFKEWETLHLEESQGREIDGKCITTEYRIITDSTETYIKVNEQGKMMNLKWKEYQKQVQPACTQQRGESRSLTEILR